MSNPKQENTLRGLILSFAALIVLFLLFGVFAIYNMQKVSRLNLRTYNHPLVVSNAAIQVNVSIVKMHRSMKDVVFSHSSSKIEQSIEAVNEEEKLVYQNLNIVKNNILGEEGKFLEISARDLLDKWRPIRNEVIKLIRNGRQETAANIMIDKNSNHVFRLEEKMLGLMTYAKNKALEFTRESEKMHSRLNVTTIIFLIVGILISLLAAFWTIKQTKIAQQIIHESEARYRSLIEQQTDLVSRFRPDGKFIFVNDTYSQFFNKPKEELIGNTWEPLPVDDDIEIIKEKLSTLSPENPTVIIENRVFSGKGEIHWMQFINSGLFDGKGDLQEIQSVGRDITEQKRAENALRESEKKYRLLADNASDVIWTRDMNFNLTYLSPSFETLTGYSIEESMALPDSERMTPTSLELMVNIFEEELKLEAQGNADPSRARTMEIEMIRKDGSTVWIEVTIKFIRNQTGQAVGMLGISRDVSDRKQAEKALQQSEERYRAMMESMKDPVYICSQDYRVEYMNPAMIKRTGRDATGESCFKALHDRDKKCPWCLYDKVQLGELAESDIVSPKDNRSYHVSQTPIVRKDGSVSAMTVFRDTTDIIQLETQLRQSQKMEAIGILAGGVAHDFNNILTTIIGNASLALMDVVEDESLRKDIEDIKIAGERAAALTRQLLAFSRKQIVQPELQDLNELLTGIEKMIGRLIREDIEILVIPESGLWQIEIDPGQMEQVVMNLVVNARDAMANGGKLTIETANIDLDEKYFRQHGIVEAHPDAYVMLAVSDTGIGMDKETQEHIFDPFYTTKEIGKGTGLGLSTVYGIVKQNNGFIWFCSEPGQGSTFKIYLPKAKEEVKEEVKKSTPAKNLGGSETVLIVEDDASLQKLAQKSLQAYGYRVLVAENGEDALGVSKDHDGSIDLMVTDVVMPKMGGKETAKQLQPLYPKMKVIYMSGYTDDAIVNKGVLAPGLNFIGKPYSPKGLARKVREVLDKKQD